MSLSLSVGYGEKVKVDILAFWASSIIYLECIIDKLLYTDCHFLIAVKVGDFFYVDPT